MLSAGAAPSPAAAQTSPPGLVVVLVVDQMRADTIERYGDAWSGGLRRLLDDGAVFREAKHSYFGTLTCAGHATIATGTIPSTHGILLDGWWDAVAGRRVRCTADNSVEAVAYGSGAREQHGPATMRVASLADELRLQNDPSAQVAAFAVKARAAVPLAGHRGDAVAWFDPGNVWTTSTAFAEAPVPFVADYIRTHPVEAALGRVWTPVSAGTNGGDGSFAHRLAPENDSGDADRAFYTAWRRSPWADEYVAGLATAAVDALELGRGAGTDYLAVGFSAADYVGHDFGPHSAEIEDTYLR
ncbi:MAG: alkaline phosphatase family protein, partial [Dehalococcoidia bacterium]|nr:alkaline phosphatase family protein [Dehalococcoidia bacterium]